MPEAQNTSDRSPAPAGSREATARRLRSVRSRFRESAHEQAHDGDEAHQRHEGKLPDNPLIPHGAPRYIQQQDELLELVSQLRAPEEQAFAYDSEFIGESNYRPRLCLIQVATPSGITLIDPLAGLDLHPFWELFGDPNITKVVHAGEQDLEPVVRARIRPANVIDTQVVAGFCALPYPTSLSRLVEHVVGVKLGKGLTFTQWDQRPLSKKQLAYAADDVRFLPALADRLLEQAAARGHERWAREECQRRAEMVGRNDHQEPWERVRGTGGMSGGQLAILRELAAWRDEVAQATDLPARAFLKDDVLVDLARRPPDGAKLAQIKFMPRPVVEQYGGQILEAIARGRQGEPVAQATRVPEPTLPEKFAADAAFSLLQTIAVGRGIDPALLANRRDIEAFSRLVSRRKPLDGHPLMQGWRREAAGELMQRLMQGGGQARLDWVDGRPHLRDVSTPDGPA
jgi:ribonuclease D